MMVLRWVRSLTRFVLGGVLITPVVALPIAVLLDRGPGGETRLSPHVFPLVLWLFDDFAWTCARNSLIFAVLVSLLSLAPDVYTIVVSKTDFENSAVRGVVVVADQSQTLHFVLKPTPKTIATVKTRSTMDVVRAGCQLHAGDLPHLAAH